MSTQQGNTADSKSTFFTEEDLVSKECVTPEDVLRLKRATKGVLISLLTIHNICALRTRVPVFASGQHVQD